MKKLLSLLLALTLVLTCLGTVCFAESPEVEYTVDGETFEGTLLEAAEAISPKGGSIKLLKDIALSTEEIKSYQVKVQSSFSMDLNGHTISGFRLFSVSGKGVADVTHIYDSVGGGALVSIAMPLLVSIGGIHLENITLWSDTQQCVSYNDTTGLYNDQNLIENCVLANNAWGGLSFNNTTTSQAKTCVTVKNSTLANMKKGSAVVRQQKAIAANVEFGENVTLLGGGDVAHGVQAGILVKGQKPVKQAEKVSFTVLDKTFDGLTAWKTTDGETVTEPNVPANPLDRVQPYLPEVSADPQLPADPALPEGVEPAAPVEQTPVTEPAPAPEKSGLDSVGLILDVLGVVLNAAVIVLLLKKRKD